MVTHGYHDHTWKKVLLSDVIKTKFLALSKEEETTPASICGKLVRIDEKMGGAKSRRIRKGNLLEAKEDLRPWCSVTL